MRSGSTSYLQNEKLSTAGIETVHLGMHKLTMRHPAIILEELPKQSLRRKTHLRQPVWAYRCIFAALLNTDANIWLLRKQ